MIEVPLGFGAGPLLNSIGLLLFLGGGLKHNYKKNLKGLYWQLFFLDFFSYAQRWLATENFGLRVSLFEARGAFEVIPCPSS